MKDAVEENSSLNLKLAKVENQVREFNMELEEYRAAKEKLDEENEKLKQGAKEAMSE